DLTLIRKTNFEGRALKQHAFFIKRDNSSLLSIALVILCLLLPASAFADEAGYFYDDAGRLSRVVKGSEGLIYNYDDVGNLLSINKGTVTAGLPVIQSINPDVLFIGSTTSVTIKGLNLFTTKEVTSSSPHLSIRQLNITDTEIITEITVSADASAGTIVNITVTTLYGSTNIQATLISSGLSFSPSQLTMTPGSIEDITASIIPNIGRDVTITINNSNPAIVSAPKSLTIPSTGYAGFAVNAIKAGSSFIKSGNASSFVLVKNPETVEDFISRTTAVSVYIEPPLGNSTTTALPVSVYVDQPMGSSTTVSLPVSAKISP
ncbi:MAG: hypothetical protein QMD01_02035, partial [Thermodesulfovibrionales bacterium]|nr:hypothetical protein [Thermodesulfovibrionales bacterium]